MRQPQGWSWYNGLAVQASQRFSGGLQMLLSYTWSHLIDNLSGPQFNRGLSDVDRTHIFVSSVVWDLPKLTQMNPVIKHVLGGWQMSGIISVESGTPITVISSKGNSLAPGYGTGTDRGQLVPGVDPNLSGLSRSQEIVQYFNKAAYTDPPLGSRGNVGRNTLRGPGLANTDFMIGKSFVLSGTWEIPLAKTSWYGGWQLGTILSVSDGLPFTAALSGDVLGQGNQSTFDMPNRLGGPGCNTSVNPGNVQQYIKLSCFAFPNPSVLLGNGGRNQLFGPGVVNADLSLFKNIKLRFINESAHLQVRMEAYNMPNRANFAAPLTNNKLFDTKGNPVNFAGQITALQTPARVLQLGVKLLW